MSPTSSGLSKGEARNQPKPGDKQSLAYYLILTFNGLHGLISHKIKLFIITAVRTSNPAIKFVFTTVGTHLKS
jgi:hypothetical protein